jgi:hypothetical protein
MQMMTSWRNPPDDVIVDVHVHWYWCKLLHSFCLDGLRNGLPLPDLWTQAFGTAKNAVRMFNAPNHQAVARNPPAEAV